MFVNYIYFYIEAAVLKRLDHIYPMMFLQRFKTVLDFKTFKERAATAFTITDDNHNQSRLLTAWECH